MDGNKKPILVVLIALTVLLGGVSIYLGIATSNKEQSPTTSFTDTTTTTPVIPQEVILSNLTSSSATLSWYTTTDSKGYVKYSTGSSTIQLTALDYQDSGTSQSRKVHYVQITSLTANTAYTVDIYINDSVYSGNPTKTFTTLKQSDTIATPQNILVTAPSNFTSGIIYAHARNGSEYSSTISVLATTKNISLPISNLKNTTTGEAFTLTSSSILISAIDITGIRARDIVSATDTKATLPTLTSSEVVYASNSAFSPVTTTATTPTTTTTTTNTNTNTTPTTTTETDTTVTTTQTTTTAAQTLPNTALELSDIENIVPYILAVLFIYLGIRLKIGSKNAYR